MTIFRQTTILEKKTIMSETIIFDTHRFVKRMTDAGLATPIAEVLADTQAQILESNLATKTDPARLEAKITKWNVGTMFAFGSITVAAIKFL